MTNWNHRKTKSIREEKILNNLYRDIQLAKVKIAEKEKTEKTEKEETISIRLWVLLLILVLLIALFYFVIYF